MEGTTHWDRGGRSGSGEVLPQTVILIPHPLHCMGGGERKVMNEVEPRRKGHTEGRHF